MFLLLQKGNAKTEERIAFWGDKDYIVVLHQTAHLRFFNPKKKKTAHLYRRGFLKEMMTDRLIWGTHNLHNKKSLIINIIISSRKCHH